MRKAKELTKRVSNSIHNTSIERSKIQILTRRANISTQKSVNHLRKIMICLCLLQSLHTSEAQLLDDSTKNVYGAHSTRFFYPSSLLSVPDSLHSIDTLLRSYGLLSVPERTNFSYVNLGSLNTATRRLFYVPPKQIGTRSGLTAYTPYFVPTEEIKLYETRSPYISTEVLFGDEGRSELQLIFSRNIQPRWNLGARFRRRAIDKQIGPRIRDDRQSISTSYQLHTSTYTEDSLYAFYFLFSGLTYKSFDSGGSSFSLDDPPATRFVYRSATSTLTQARSNTSRYGLQMLQRLRIFPYTYLYLKGQIGREHFSFYDDLLSNDSLFYEQFFVSKEKTNDWLSFSEQSVEGGALWKRSRSSYRGYLGHRWTNYVENDSSDLPLKKEMYLGLEVVHPLPRLGEIELSAKLLQNQYYWLQTGLQHRLMKLNAWLTRYKANAMSKSYTGNHHHWKNTYRSPRAVGLELTTPTYLLYRNIELKAGLQATSLWNYIYYNKSQIPVQLPKKRSIQIGQGSIETKIAFLGQHIFLEARLQIRKFLSSSQEAFAFPTWQTKGSLYYEGKWFNHSVRIQAGLRARWRSNYYGFSYQPALQQFYTQNTFLLQSYTPMDLFLRAKIRSFRFFAHFLHFNKSTGSSYFATPYYLGEQPMFDVGVLWHFFN